MKKKTPYFPVPACLSINLQFPLSFLVFICISPTLFPINLSFMGGTAGWITGLTQYRVSQDGSGRMDVYNGAISVFSLSLFHTFKAWPKWPWWTALLVCDLQFVHLAGMCIYSSHSYPFIKLYGEFMLVQRYMIWSAWVYVWVPMWVPVYVCLCVL